MKRVIGFVSGSILVWILVVGGSLAMSFDRIAESNRVMTELEWSFVCDDAYNEAEGDYSAIRVVEGSSLFIGVMSNEREAVLMDERGSVISGPYDSLEPLGDGYVRFEDTPDGVTAMGDNRKNRRARIGVLDRTGKELAEEEAEMVLAGAAEANGTKGSVDFEADDEFEKQNDAKESAGDLQKNDGAQDSDGDQKSVDGKYTVARSDDGKYAGIRDNTGKWLIPPVFDEIELTDDQTHAVVRNGQIIGIAVLGE